MGKVIHARLNTARDDMGQTQQAFSHLPVPPRIATEGQKLQVRGGRN